MTDLIPGPVLAVLVGVAAVLVGVWYFEREREKQRLEQLVSWATGLGYAIEVASRTLQDAGLGSELTLLPIFGRGRARKVRNVVRGLFGHDGTGLLFDYRYTTQNGKNSATLEQTIAAFELPGANIPAFELRPEGLFARIGQALGDPDIDFDSNPDFSGAYQLRGKDADAVRRLFERTAVAYLAATDDWSAEGSGNWIIVFNHHRRHKPEDMTEFIGQARMVVRAIVGR